MKVCGVLILLAGVICLLAALGMDTSVATGFGRVNNLGLMKDQQNYITISALMVVVGTVVMLASRSRGAKLEEVAAATKTCPECAEVVKRDAKLCRFCGNRNFNEDVPEQAGAAAAPSVSAAGSHMKQRGWDTIPVACAAILALSTAGIGLVWVWGDSIDASGNGSYTAKDVLVGAWMEVSGQTAPGTDATASNEAADASLEPSSSRMDMTKWRSTRHRKLSAPDANGCIKELAEEVGLHCAEAK
jgi:hypothetical protein